MIRPLGHDCVFSGSGERFRNAPWGVFGGEDGQTGRFVRVEADGSLTQLPNKPSGVHFDSSQRIMIETPGAGGYGEPATRTSEDIDTDRRSGKFSERSLKQNYL
jgi:N-methylhydantoinase B